ncbi:hypothetical protein KR51_00016530 [Rubidibacter lacunae KORDI 51-2]|uniref:Ssl1498 family light-harvesting-like protein n=1 Tax=Rubidibacter lacunae KORDI 51-2 TaxID=582515 RepID=U5DQ26_9CHRO|nr:ssl1498 family light-harvesting-like protein [Rubidibacter lacunae]ERN41800.1 hypothetical protein KR51_00016530 [Rubidibacter lacunae KORDI 51-2]
MPYVEEDGGRLNNYAITPKIYRADPPTASQKRNYIILGALSTVLLAGLMFVAVVASNSVA